MTTNDNADRQSSQAPRYQIAATPTPKPRSSPERVDLRLDHTAKHITYLPRARGKKQRSTRRESTPRPTPAPTENRPAPACTHLNLSLLIQPGLQPAVGVERGRLGRSRADDAQIGLHLAAGPGVGLLARDEAAGVDIVRAEVDPSRVRVNGDAHLWRTKKAWNKNQRHQEGRKEKGTSEGAKDSEERHQLRRQTSCMVQMHKDKPIFLHIQVQVDVPEPISVYLPL